VPGRLHMVQCHRTRHLRCHRVHAALGRASQPAEEVQPFEGTMVDRSLVFIYSVSFLLVEAQASAATKVHSSIRGLN
jgi:hypothetical protein